MENAIKNANRIIAISENTKQDLVEILHINPGKIDVVYHGYNKTISTNPPVGYGKYILFVGRRSLYKNFIILEIVYLSFQNLFNHSDSKYNYSIIYFDQRMDKSK